MTKSRSAFDAIAFINSLLEKCHYSGIKVRNAHFCRGGKNELKKRLELFRWTLKCAKEKSEEICFLRKTCELVIAIANPKIFKKCGANTGLSMMMYSLNKAKFKLQLPPLTKQDKHRIITLITNQSDGNVERLFAFMRRKFRNHRGQLCSNHRHSRYCKHNTSISGCYKA